MTTAIGSDLSTLQRFSDRVEDTAVQPTSPVGNDAQIRDTAQFDTCAL